MPIRLIDLHVDWLLQYAPDATVFDPALYPGVAGRLGQTAGYLQATRAAVLACFRTADDWAGRPDSWAALVELIARCEAEFSGRLLIGADDFDRWEDDPDGLTWGVLGVEGFDAVVRTHDDLPRVRTLFERGVRLFQPVYSAGNALGGSSAEGDEAQGLTPLGRDFLGTLLAAVPGETGPRALLDLAHFHPVASGEVLAWFEADPARAERVIPVYSHGAPAHPGFDAPRALPLDHARRLRALGGFVGVGVSPPFFQSADQVDAAIRTLADLPYLGQPGMAGIGIGTDYLGVDSTLPLLRDAEAVVDYFSKRFPKPIARALVHDNARDLLARVTGSQRR